MAELWCQTPPEFRVTVPTRTRTAVCPRPTVQWAALKVHRFVIIEPPQKWELALLRSETWYGNWPNEAGWVWKKWLSFLLKSLNKVPYRSTNDSSSHKSIGNWCGEGKCHEGQQHERLTEHFRTITEVVFTTAVSFIQKLLSFPQSTNKSAEICGFWGISNSYLRRKWPFR